MNNKNKSNNRVAPVFLLANGSASSENRFFFFYVHEKENWRVKILLKTVYTIFMFALIYYRLSFVSFFIAYTTHTFSLYVCVVPINVRDFH